MTVLPSESVVSVLPSVRDLHMMLANVKWCKLNSTNEDLNVIDDVVIIMHLSRFIGCENYEYYKALTV